jgi:hypothetical protein
MSNGGGGGGGGGFESAESSKEDEVALDIGKVESERTHTCAICLEEVKSLWSLSCGHMYCRECIESHVKTLVASGDVFRVVCPTPTCRAPLRDKDVEFVCSADVTAQYRREFARINALRTREVVPCATPDCAGVLSAKHRSRADGRGPSALSRYCEICGRDTCLSCMEQHDPDEKCDAADWKRRCPKCRCLIVKSTGCNLVKCENCRINFCNLCGQEADYSHFDKDGPCKGKLGQPAAPEMVCILLFICAMALCLVPCVPCLGLAACVELVWRVRVWWRVRRNRTELPNDNRLIDV